MKMKKLHIYFIVIIVIIVEYVYGQEEGETEEATVDIVCNNKKLDISLIDFFKENNSHLDEKCSINIGEGYISYPIETSTDQAEPLSFILSNISGEYEIVGKGKEKTFIECPNFEEEEKEKNQITLFNIYDITGKISFKNIGFRNCGEKDQYTSSVNIRNSKSVYFMDCEFYNMKIPALTASESSDVTFDKVYLHDISYDEPDGIYRVVELFKGIVNIESNSVFSVTNSKFFGCPEDCKNYNLYVEEGQVLSILNSEFKNAAGGIFIFSNRDTLIMDTTIRDHDMALQNESKYDVPGALYGGGLYVNTTQTMEIRNTQFINNAVNYQGGAIFISDYADTSTYNLKNVTFNTNYSYSEGKDISVAGRNVDMTLDDIYITGGSDSRWINDMQPSIMIYSTLTLKMENIAIKNYSTNSTLIKIDDPRDTNDIKIENFHITDATIDKVIESEIHQVDIKDLKIENSNSATKGSIFKIKRGKLNFNNLKIQNFNGCSKRKNKCINRNNEIVYDRSSVLFEVDEQCELRIIDSIIKNVEMNSLFNSEIDSNIIVENTSIEEDQFINGAVSCTDTLPSRIGNVTIKNSNFNSIHNEYGPIMQVLELSENPNNKILFENLKIENSGAQKYGGIILSFSNYASDIVDFKDCKFESISAEKGIISYSENDLSEPYISNKDELIKKEHNGIIHFVAWKNSRRLFIVSSTFCENIPPVTSFSSVILSLSSFGPFCICSETVRKAVTPW